MKNILFLDMDDVLTDYIGHMRQVCGGLIPLSKDVDTLTPAEKEIREKMLRTGLDNKTFWEDLPALPHAKRFYGIVKKGFDETHILSFYRPYHPESKPLQEVRHQKIKWIQTHIDAAFDPNHMIVTDKLKEKWLVENKNRFDGMCCLIDDSCTNATRWGLNGGMGVCHQNYEQTLKDLRVRGINVQEEKFITLSMCPYHRKSKIGRQF